MKSDFILSLEDIKSKNENALELFYSGIKSEQTRRSMEGNLKRFLVVACAEIFPGDFKNRIQEFVDLSKEDQDRATSIVLAYVRKLRERASFEKSDPNYLNPSSIPNKIKPIRKLLEMNGLGLGWKRIYSLYPEKDNINKGRAYTRAEIQKMLEYSESIESDFIILASSSGGFRVGAWNDQIWGNIFPVYEINGGINIDLQVLKYNLIQQQIGEFQGDRPITISIPVVAESNMVNPFGNSLIYYIIIDRVLN
jgi:hypothetical protein